MEMQNSKSWQQTDNKGILSGTFWSVITSEKYKTWGEEIQCYYCDGAKHIGYYNF